MTYVVLELAGCTSCGGDRPHETTAAGNLRCTACGALRRVDEVTARRLDKHMAERPALADMACVGAALHRMWREQA